MATELNGHTSNQNHDDNFAQKDEVTNCYLVGDSLRKSGGVNEDSKDSLIDCSHRDDGTQKSLEREERLRIAKERQAEEKHRRLRDLKEASEKAQEFRRKQEEERRKKVEDMRRREDEHRAIVEERRKKLLLEQKEKVRAVLKKNDERKAKVTERKSKTRGSDLESRAKTCRSEDTLSGNASPWRSVPQRRRPHSIAGRCPSYAGHTVASQMRRGRGEEVFTTSAFCCSRFRSVSPTPTESKCRTRSTDCSRKSRIDHQQHAFSRGPMTSSIGPIRSIVQPLPPPCSVLSTVASPRVKSSPMRPSQLSGVVPHVTAPARRPMRTPSPKTAATTASKPIDKPTSRVTPSSQKPPTLQHNGKTNNGKMQADGVTAKPISTSSNKSKDVDVPHANRDTALRTAVKKIPSTQDSSPPVDKAIDLISDFSVDKSEHVKHVEQDEYKVKLAENRRLARELAEKKVADEKRLEEEQRMAEEERKLKEEEEERRHEEEELRLAAELKHFEVERLQKAMEKENERRRLEEERMEVERKERLVAEQKAKEENERREQERLEKSKRDEEDRAERKKKLELIMKRVKVEDNAPKIESSPVSSAGVSVNFDQQVDHPTPSAACVTSPADNALEGSASFRSPILQQMMGTRAKSQSPGDGTPTKESSGARPDLAVVHPVSVQMVSSEFDGEMLQHTSPSDRPSSSSIVSSDGSGLCSSLHESSHFQPNSKASDDASINSRAVEMFLPNDSAQPIDDIIAICSSSLESGQSQNSDEPVSFRPEGETIDVLQEVLAMSTCDVPYDKPHYHHSSPPHSDSIAGRLGDDDAYSSTAKQSEDELCKPVIVNRNPYRATELLLNVKALEECCSSEALVVHGDEAVDVYGLPEKQVSDDLEIVSPGEMQAMVTAYSPFSHLENSDLRDSDWELSMNQYKVVEEEPEPELLPNRNEDHEVLMENTNAFMHQSPVFEGFGSDDADTVQDALGSERSFGCSEVVQEDSTVGSALCSIPADPIEQMDFILAEFGNGSPHVLNPFSDQQSSDPLHEVGSPALDVGNTSNYPSNVHFPEDPVESLLMSSDGGLISLKSENSFPVSSLELSKYVEDVSCDVDSSFVKCIPSGDLEDNECSQVSKDLDSCLIDWCADNNETGTNQSPSSMGLHAFSESPANPTSANHVQLDMASHLSPDPVYNLDEDSDDSVVGNPLESSGIPVPCVSTWHPQLDNSPEKFPFNSDPDAANPFHKAYEPNYSDNGDLWLYDKDVLDHRLHSTVDEESSDQLASFPCEDIPADSVTSFPCEDFPADPVTSLEDQVPDVEQVPLLSFSHSLKDSEGVCKPHVAWMHSEIDEDKDFNTTVLQPHFLPGEDYSSDDNDCDVIESMNLPSLPDPSPVEHCGDYLLDERDAEPKVSTMMTPINTGLHGDSASCVTGGLTDLSGIPDVVPVVAFEEGGKFLHPSISEML